MAASVAVLTTMRSIFPVSCGVEHQLDRGMAQPATQLRLTGYPPRLLAGSRETAATVRVRRMTILTFPLADSGSAQWRRNRK